MNKSINILLMMFIFPLHFRIIISLISVKKLTTIFFAVSTHIRKEVTPIVTYLIYVTLFPKEI